MKYLSVMAAILGALAVAGCSDDAPPCGFGDPSLPMEMEVVYRTVDGETAAVTEAGQVPLVQPPQGGKVLLVSARANNVSGCRVQLTASLRDQCSNRIAALEQRPVELTAGADGWGEPTDPMQLNNYANVPACPTAASTRDIEDEPYLLKVRIVDDLGRTAEKEVVVTPVCAEPEFEGQCRCECDKNYMLGAACEPEIDGGVPPGTCDPDGGV